VIASLLLDLERFLLPNNCISCDRSIERGVPDDLVCRVCLTRMRPLLLAGSCNRCTQPMPPVGPCRFCVEWPETLRRVESAVWLGREASTVVHSLKYEGRPRLAAAVAAVICRSLPRPDGPSVIIPLPTTHRRIRRRGYDQSVMIADAVAANWKVPIRKDCLLRTSSAGSQTALTPELRQANVAGAYVAAGPAGCSSAVLIDDVLTTGATLWAASAALIDAGWSDIRGITFARAAPYEMAVLGTGFAN
jgi:predicted amidophosphoribosyltransferase